MFLDQMVQRMPYWYEAAQEGDYSFCIYAVSAPGMGKTHTLMKAPAIVGKRLGKSLGLVVINGATLNEQDALGYLMLCRSPEVSYISSAFTRPFWWTTEDGKQLEDYKDGGFIILDEADKLPVEAKKVVGEAALSGRLGPHRLPPGWVVWMAGNTAAHRSGSTRELDHLINRRMQIDIAFDIKSFEGFCVNDGVHPVTMAFAKQNIQIITQGVPKEQGPWCTPRSLVQADKYLQVLARHNNGVVPVDPITVEEIAGKIGDAAAAQYFAFFRLQREMPSIEDIIANPDKVRVPEKPDAQMLVVYQLAHAMTEENAGPCVKYMNRFPIEFGVTCGSTAVRRNSKLVRTPAFVEWARVNSSLMAAIAAPKS
jgi:hypothetical protein